MVLVIREALIDLSTGEAGKTSCKLGFTERLRRSGGGSAVLPQERAATACQQYGDEAARQAAYDEVFHGDSPWAFRLGTSGLLHLSGQRTADS